ncbi:hypothetical protein DITRI_Ditri08aG0014200 [Diplodiscus trichospermus]
MEFPLFRNPWNESSFPRRIPVQLNPKAMPPQPSKPKVVSIPVHFVGPERSRSDSVIKIQKVFRGFMVRKSMKKIKAIREEVSDIERSVSKKETVDLIRNDSKERLKVNEMLMSLLLKLDSIRGVDSGVRDCRKSVIKRAIALQELVDAIVSGDQSIDSNDAQAIDQSQGIADSADDYHQTLEPEDHDEATNSAEFMPDSSKSEMILQTQETVESNKREEEEADLAANLENLVEEEEAAVEENGTCRPEITNNNNAEFVPDSSKSEVILRNQETVESNKQEEEEADSSANLENQAEEEEASAMVEENETCGPDDRKEESGDGDKRSEKLLERMVEENEKVMGMMAMLMERNEMQRRMLSALSQRVEQLEKAMSRRKKRRSVVGCGGDCVEKRCVSKKCGKKMDS